MAAVPSERISKIVGYQLAAGDFSDVTPNLPQRIAIFAEANTANQASLDTDGVEVTSATQAGELFGFGSPIHAIMRILRPVQGGGIAGIPTVVYAQEEASGATAKEITITPTGTATANATHTVVVAGRRVVDGQSYNFVVSEGDSAADVAGKIEDAINAVLGAPVTATETTGVTTATAKWAGLTSDEIEISIDINGNDAGMTYAVADPTAGAGTPAIGSDLAKIGNEWDTVLINGYGTESDVMNALEQFNGRPSNTNPTGRYTGTIMRPFIAVTGSTAEDPSSITDTRADDATIAIAPAPESKGIHYEAAANYGRLLARQAQDNPHLDISGQRLPDMPTPKSIGKMADSSERDIIVKKGCSTADLVNNQYEVVDFVTTYHPVSEPIPQYRFVRNLMIDFNVRYGYYLLELRNVVDHAIAADDDIVNVGVVIKPKQWKAVVTNYAEGLAQRALIADADFMIDSIDVRISATNPDRLETSFSYKRTGFARISATVAEAGFNFGTLDL